MEVTCEDLLLFWFGPEQLSDKVSPQFEKWFVKNEIFDNKIRQKFGHLLENAEAIMDWREIPRGRLACIILWDQFPRNLFRNSPKSFAFDDRAKDMVKTSIEQGDERKHHPIERQFLYLPFEHSEKLDDQNFSLKKFKTLLEESPASLREHFQMTLDYAEQHFEIIKRFGRFPHRNKILNRQSTREELEFLKQPHSSF